MNNESAVFAALADNVAVPSGDVPEWMLYMPSGKQRITPYVDGRAETIEITVDAAAADRLQADLSQRLKRKVKPFIDFDHEGKASAGRPLEFKWEDGRGVMCRVAWSESGRRAVAGGDYSYFSPTFRFDRATKRVAGLLKSGPVGGLVNDPAFTEIGEVKARAAQETSNQTPKQQMDRNEKVLAALVQAGLLSDSELDELSADNAAATVSARIAELKNKPAPQPDESAIEAANARIAALEQQLAAVKKREAESVVDAAVRAGRIPPKDEKTRAFWVSQIIANETAAVEALNAIPVNAALAPTGARSASDAPQPGDAEEKLSRRQMEKALEIMNAEKVPFAAAWPRAGARVTD